MPIPVELSPETIFCLRDEAYVLICRQVLSLELARLEAEKAHIEATRPPFMMLASKQKRETYETSLSSALHSETELRAKLYEIDRLDHSLKSRLQDVLNDYFIANYPENAVFDEICELVNTWQNAVGSLGEHALAFARDTKAAYLAQGHQRRLHAIGVLRSAADYLHNESEKVEVIATAAARLAEGKLPGEVRLPALPVFRPPTWVDQVFSLPVAKCTAELQAAEAEARAFCTGGKNDLLITAEKTRAASLRQRQAHLESYWDGLRAHALEHYIKPRDVDEVIAELAARYLADDIERFQRERTKNPFVVG